MTTLQQEHLVQSVADALQFISYYHPRDYLQALARAYEREQSPSAKDAIAQILTNSRLCAEGHRPVCQDTGIVNVFLKIGMGAQGLGGLSTVLDVKTRTYPTHAANQPVAMIPNCAATRHAHFVLDGSGPAEFEEPKLSDWPAVTWTPDAKSTRVDLNRLTREQVASWKPGQRLLLSGKLLTGRDAAHKRIQDMLARGEKLPVDFANRVIYYVGPVDPVRDEVVGPAGPTTATRMDKFTEMMLAKTGLAAMIGKGERGPAAVEAIRKHKAASLIAIGGGADPLGKKNPQPP